MQWQELPALVAHFRRKLATMTRLGECDLTPFLLISFVFSFFVFIAGVFVQSR